MPIIDFSVIDEANPLLLKKERENSNYFKQRLEEVMKAKEAREAEEARKKKAEPTIMDMLREGREDIEKERREEKIKKLRRRLYAIVSGGMRHSLKSGKDGHHWESLVNYNLADLIKHLESGFQPGMCWESYGKGKDGTKKSTEYWVIDHVKPVSSFYFDSYNDPQFQECWALENLYPMWAKDNAQKHAKYPYILPTHRCHLYPNKCPYAENNDAKDKEAS